LNLKSLLITVAKIIAAILGIFAVFHFGKINWSDFITQLSLIRPGFFIVSLIIVTLVMVYVTRRWRCFISEKKRQITFRSLVGINFIGCFFNLFLPSSFGGDLIRAVYLNKEVKSWRLSVSSVFLDRFIGLLSLFFLAFISLLFKIIFEETSNSTAFIYLIVGTICLSIGWIALINLHSILKSIFKFKNQKLIKYLTKYELFSENINLSNYPKSIIIKGFGISVLGNLLSAFSIYFIALALNIQVGIFPILIVFPLVTVISMIPISIGGIGLREGAFVFFLAGYSVTSSSSIAIALLYFSSIVFLGVIGGIIFSFSRYSLEKYRS
jgi:uncharacterized protein (TIRG00374 family)